MAGGKGIHIFVPKYFLLLLKIPLWFGRTENVGIRPVQRLGGAGM